jgi:hypothetical protein
LDYVFFYICAIFAQSFYTESGIVSPFRHFRARNAPKTDGVVINAPECKRTSKTQLLTPIEKKRKNNNKPNCCRLSPRPYFYINTMPRGRAGDFTREELVHFLDASSIKPTSQQH